MHRHDHDESGVDGLPTRTARTDTADPAMLYQAAAAGRHGRRRSAGAAGAAARRRQQRRAAGSRTRSARRCSTSSPPGAAPLEEPVRADMEGRLGHSFADVRVHTGDAAHHSAASVNAHAYTVGSNIVFQRDKYDPGSDGGRTMLAHELTHVVQQRSGPVDGTATGTGVRVSDPSDRFEREAAATAERAMSVPAVPATAQTVRGGDRRRPARC